MIWPPGATRKLHQAFETSAFALGGAFMREWAAFEGERPEAFLAQFCLETYERISRNLESGYTGPLEGRFLKSFGSFQTERQRLNSNKPYTAAKESEARLIGVPPDPEISTRPHFLLYLRRAAEAEGFAQSRLKHGNIVGRPHSMPVQNGHVLLFGASPARVWWSWGSIGSTCLLAPAEGLDSPVWVNIDALFPGLSVYRTYKNWQEAALGARALIHAHKALADALAG